MSLRGPKLPIDKVFPASLRIPPFVIANFVFTDVQHLALFRAG